MHLILHTVHWFTVYWRLWCTFLFYFPKLVFNSIFCTLYPRFFKISLFSLLGGHSVACCISESSQLIKHRIYVGLISCRVTSQLTRLSELRSRQRDAPLMGIYAHHRKTSYKAPISQNRFNLLTPRNEKFPPRLLAHVRNCCSRCSRAADKNSKNEPPYLHAPMVIVSLFLFFFPLAIKRMTCFFHTRRYRNARDKLRDEETLQNIAATLLLIIVIVFLTCMTLRSTI